MRPRVILSNAISLNGALTGYDVDYGVYYPILLSYAPDAVLVGADTVLSAAVDIPPEEPSDLRKRPSRSDEQRPWWVVVDSRGRLEGVLHFYRRMEYIRGIIVLISEQTPQDYLDYLQARDYEYLVTGMDRIDLEKAISLLALTYNVRTLVSDTGGTLDTALLESGLVDELSVVVTPVLSGQTGTLLYSPESGKRIDLLLKECGDVGEGYVHLMYEVRR